MDHLTRRTSSGVAIALVSAGSFALSGSLASAMFASGWSPGAAVTVRIVIAGMVLLGPAINTMRGRWDLLRRNITSVLMFGLLAVAGAQLFYFNAVRTLSVGVALMIEYMGLVLVVGWQAITTRTRPHRATMLGVLLAIVGLVLVLDVAGNLALDLGGVLWAMGAAVGLATYFVVAGSEHNTLPPIPMASFGMFFGALLLVAAGAIGVLPMAATTRDVELSGVRFPWFVGVAALGVIAGAVAYSTGVISARLLGAKLAAFLGLTEVLFAVLFAWVLLDELPEPIQLAGGLLILAGIAVVRSEQLHEDSVDVLVPVDGEGTEPS